MAWMSDEAYELQQENREKKALAQQVRNRRGMAGKGGRVRLSSDRLTQKQWEAKNGECKSYRMNEPMTWEQFNEMPDDLKVLYIKAIRNKYQTPDAALADAMGVDFLEVVAEMHELGIGQGTDAGSMRSIDWLGSEQQAAFNKWWYKEQNLPLSGAAKFEEPMNDILKKLNEKLSCLGDKTVRVDFYWEVMED
jgi:hypothetical protein